MALGVALGDLVGGIVNTIQDDDAGKKYYKDQLGIWREIPLPEYDDEDLIAPFLTSAGTMEAQTYDPVIAGDPRFVQEDPALREAQLRAALGMEQISEEGLPLQDRLLADEAQRAISQEFNRANESIIRNLAARGRGGGGTELAARLAAAESGAELARGMGSDLAQQAIMNRVQALRDSERMHGDIRAQDARTAALNADVENNFTKWLSELQTTAAMNAARARERAQDYNIRNAQRIRDTNVLSRYDTARENQQRMNDLQDRLFAARYDKARGMTGALDKVAEAQRAREVAKQQNVRSIAGGTGGIIDSVFKLKAGGGAAGAAGA